MNSRKKRIRTLERLPVEDFSLYGKAGDSVAKVNVASDETCVIEKTASGLRYRSQADLDEIARLKEIIACADTPLMRDVMAERDRYRQGLMDIIAHMKIVAGENTPSGVVSIAQRALEAR